METNELKAGDVVILKSEKYSEYKNLMTIGYLDQMGDALCYYFLDGQLKDVKIQVEALCHRK